MVTDLAGEGRSLDVVVGKLEVDDVEAGLLGVVGDLQLAVPFVVALDLGLAGALHGEGHATISCRHAAQQGRPAELRQNGGEI